MVSRIFRFKFHGGENERPLLADVSLTRTILAIVLVVTHGLSGLKGFSGASTSWIADSMGKVSVKLKTIGLTPWIEPNAGMFLWCQLSEGLDAADVARCAITDGLVLAPGNAFSLTQAASGFMRFNVAQMLDPTIIPLLERAMRQSSKASG